VGVDMKIDILRDTAYSQQPVQECLLHTPKWDFNWQRLYQFDEEDPLELPRLRGGDTLQLRCTYDNTLGNDAVAEALEEAGETEPADVYLGQGTLDEMCLGIFGVVFPR
jgi:hypothetical protein